MSSYIWQLFSNEYKKKALYKDLSLLSVCFLHGQGIRSNNRRELIMLCRMKLQDFVHDLLDQPEVVEKAALIIQAIL